MFVAEARALIADGAEAIVLGFAGLAGLHLSLQEQLGVPVVDGVLAAVSLCDDLVHQRLTTSKVGAYAPLAPTEVA